MRVLTCLVAVGLAAATTGCIETMNSGYGGGYGNSGYYSGSSPYAASPYYGSSPYAASPYYSGYQRPVTNNYYTTPQPQPQVITQTRYVPVPTAAPPQRRQRDRDGDGIPDWKERRQRDSDGDGIPDRQERRQERRANRTN
jgi:hypothetical protein